MSVVSPQLAAAQVNKTATLRLLLKKAAEARKAGNYAEAATVWMQIYLQDPGQPMSLYNAALMEEKAGDLHAAAKHLREFLSVTTPKHPRYTLAKVRLQSVAAKADAAEKSKLAERLLAERQAREAADKKAAAARAAGEASGSGAGAGAAAGGAGQATGSARWPGWTLVGVGGALALTAGGLYLVGASDYDAVVADQKSGKLSTADANAQVSDLQRNDVIYAVVGGVGLAAVGVGVYLLASGPRHKGDAVTVAPLVGGGLRGAMVRLRF